MKSILSKILILMLLILIVGCASISNRTIPEQFYVNYAIEVVDEENHEPIEGALVMLNESEGIKIKSVTDENGIAVIQYHGKPLKKGRNVFFRTTANLVVSNKEYKRVVISTIEINKQWRYGQPNFMQKDIRVVSSAFGGAVDLVQEDASLDTSLGCKFDDWVLEDAFLGTSLGCKFDEIGLGLRESEVIGVSPKDLEEYREALESGGYYEMTLRGNPRLRGATSTVITFWRDKLMKYDVVFEGPTVARTYETLRRLMIKKYGSVLDTEKDYGDNDASCGVSGEGLYVCLNFEYGKATCKTTISANHSKLLRDSLAYWKAEKLIEEARKDAEIGEL